MLKTYKWNYFLFIFIILYENIKKSIIFTEDMQYYGNKHSFLDCSVNSPFWSLTDFDFLKTGSPIKWNQKTKNCRL